MSQALFSPDRTAATSIGALASILGVHRNRIPEWRKLNAPASLAFADWLAWFRSTKRLNIAYRLSQAVGLPTDPTPMPAAPAEPTDDDAAGDADDPTDEPAAEDDDAIKRRWLRARADSAELELSIKRGEVLHRDHAYALARKLGSLVVERFDPGTYAATNAWAATLPPAARDALRRALVADATASRSTLVDAIRAILPPIVHYQGIPA